MGISPITAFLVKNYLLLNIKNVPGTLRSDGTIACIAPKIHCEPPGMAVTVELSFDGGRNFLRQNHSVWYYGKHLVLSIQFLCESVEIE